MKIPKLLNGHAASLCALLSTALIMGAGKLSHAQNINLTPGIDYTKGNYAYSPPLRKFVDKLPGLTASGANGLGQYIPIAVPNTPYGSPYPNSQYYEIGLVEYIEQLHQDLPNTGTKLRGYVQIVPSTYPGAVPLDTAHGLSQNVTDINGKQLYGADKPHYAGPMIVSFKNVPVRVKFMNLLPTGPAGRLFLPTDSTIPGAGDGPNQIGVDGNGMPVYEQYTQNRANIHLHGGFPPWNSDGTPHQWITPAGEATSYQKGPDAVNVPDMPNPGDGSMTYYWPNLQSGRLLWYHDHTYGSTGPDVYSGEAAPYLLVDQDEENALAAAGVPGVVAAGPNATNDLDHLLTLIIQDKTFVPDTNALSDQDPNWLTDIKDGMTGAAPTMGNLWFPHVYSPNQWPANPDGSGANALGRWDYGPWFWPPWIVNTPYPPALSHTPEAFMDTPLVNGQPYPYVDVKPTKYRIKVLNASDDRYWNLQLYVASSIVSNLVVTAGGSGYDPLIPPNVTISGGGGMGCKGTASVDPTNGSVVGINIDVAGSGFTNPPTVTIDPPTAPGGAQATAEAQIYTGQTEVGLCPASLTAGIPYPVTWRATTGYTPEILDGRNGGVPDPTKRGPAFVKIANECGVIPSPVILSNTPVGYEQNKKNIVILNVKEHTLWLAPAERADVVVDFSKFAGKTVILYNDAPAALPAGDGRNDTFAEDGDMTGGGGPANTDPGMGPNTRTVMQFRVAAADATTPNADSSCVPDYYDANMVAALADPVQGLPAVFAATQPVPVVPESAYNTIGYAGGSTTDTYAKIQDTSMTFIPYGQATPVTMPMKSKCIQELFDDNGRLNATLGTEVPFSNSGNQTTVPLNYVDPITEIFNDGETQLWKITHNGVDSHCVHFHLVNVQVVNRVGWDGQVVPPDPDELGWKETVRMHPLQDIIIATRAVSVPVPFGVTNSVRLMNPTQPIGSTIGFSQWNPQTGNALATPTTNSIFNFNWAYIWHCHLLGHEENDMMRPISLVVNSTVPAAPALTGTAGYGVANLSWTDGTPFDYTTGQPTTTLGNPANEIGFSVERALGASGGVFVQLTNVIANTTNFVDTTGVIGTTNQYRVAAYNNAGRAVSGIVSLRINGVPPNAPSNCVVRVTALSPINVLVTWNDLSSNESSFQIQRRTGTGAFVNIATVGANVTSWTDTTAVFGTSYAYQVAAVNPDGSSAYTAPASVAWPPAAPTTLASTAIRGTDTNALSVNLTWVDNSTNETSFRLERKGATGNFAAVATLAANAVAFADTNVLPNTAYSYRVFAVNAVGDSLSSNTNALTTPASIGTAPAAPTNLLAVATSINPAIVSLTWVDKSTNETSFEIQRLLGAVGTYTTIGIVGVNVTNYTDTSAIYPSNYTYRVRSVNFTTNSAFSSYTLSWPPTAPSGLSAVSTNWSKVSLIWSNNAAAHLGFRVDQAVGINNTNFVPVASLAPTAVAYTVTNLIGSTYYSYRVVATNAGGSAASPVASVTTPLNPAMLPAAATNLTAKVTSLTPNTIVLNWRDMSTNETAFEVQRAIGTNGYVSIGSVAANVTNYTDTSVSLVYGTNYTYIVRATNTIGASAFTAAAAVTWPPNAAPTALSARVAGMNPPWVWLTWADNTITETGFQIQRAVGTSTNFTLLASVAANVTNYSDTTVGRGTNYTYRVAATNAAGSTAFSATASVTPAISFVQAASSTAVASNTTVSVSFASAQTVSNLNIVVVGWKDTTRTITSVVDNKGKTYTLAGTSTSGTGVRQSTYYSTAAGGAGTTVTVTFNGAATAPDVRVLEYAGVTTLGRTASGTGTAATATATAAQATTAANGNVLVFGACTTTSSVTAAGTGYTSRLTSTAGNAEDQIQTANATYSATATVSGTNNWVMQLTTFQ